MDRIFRGHDRPFLVRIIEVISYPLAIIILHLFVYHPWLPRIVCCFLIHEAELNAFYYCMMIEFCTGSIMSNEWPHGLINTVEPRLSGPPLSRTSIIRHGNSLKKISKNGRVSSCYRGHRNVHLLRMRRRPHSLQLSGWIKAWFILFDYPDYSVIRHGSGITKVFG